MLVKVLLYNFFEDSTVDSLLWRVILNELPGEVAPAFDVGRHSGVCREVDNCSSCCSSVYDSCLFPQLKHLYVAMTRARMNLWVADSSPTSEPLRVSDLVVGCAPHNDI